MQRLHGACCIALIGVCLVLPLSGFGSAISQTPATSREKIVKLNVLVTDSQNRPVIDVPKEEFRILEDGAPQSISHFSKDELPLNYCIVLDTSGSMNKVGDRLIDAAQAIVKTNKPGDDMALIEFKDQPELIEKFTPSKDAMLMTLDMMRGHASRQTAVIDAVYVATQYVAGYKPVDRLSRRALIVISDGYDWSSYYKMDVLRKQLRKENIQIFAIGYDVNAIGKLKGQKEQKRAVELLTEIARETGGKAYFPQSEAELLMVASQMLDTLRTQYVIGYKPTRESKKDSYHLVSVSVADVPGRDKRTAIARTGYMDVMDVGEK